MIGLLTPHSLSRLTKSLLLMWRGGRLSDSLSITCVVTVDVKPLDEGVCLIMVAATLALISSFINGHTVSPDDPSPFGALFLVSTSSRGKYH